VELDPLGDKAGHHGIGCLAATDLICQSPLKSDSDCGQEVYMVGQGEQPTKKTTKEVTQEAEEEITRATWLTSEAAGKRHNSRQDGSGSSGDEVGDGVPSRGYPYEILR
jgi:hypothetical protein